MSSEISSDRGKEYQEIKARLETENIFVLLEEHPKDERKFRWYKDNSAYSVKSGPSSCRT